MGQKTMKFSTLDGDVIEVAFTGSAVQDGEITPAAHPVVLQMDGAADKYEPAKPTTASVTCMVDGLQLLDIYTRDGVAVTITNSTTGSILFKGYVTPNTLDQQLAGINDSVTIECVDCLGWGMYTLYEKVNGTFGSFKTLTLAEACLHIASLIGISDVRLGCHISIQSRSGYSSTEHYEKMTLSESYFFSSQTPEVINDGVDYRPLAMNCYEALEMIAESLRSAWVQVGDILYLVDDISAHDSGAAMFKRLESAGAGIPVQTGRALALSADVLDGPAKISTVPKYSLFSVKNTVEEEVELLPDIFATKLNTPYGEMYELKKDTDTYELATKLRNPLVDPYSEPGGTILFSSMLAHRVIKRPDEAKESLSEYWKYSAYDEEWTNYLWIQDDSDDIVRLASIKSAFMPAPALRQVWGLRLSIEVGFSGSYSGWPDPVSGGTCYLGIQLLQGGRYYNEVTNRWQETEHTIVLKFSSGSEWRSSFTFKNDEAVRTDIDPTDVLALSLYDGGGGIELRIISLEDEGWVIAWIKALQLSLVVFPGIRMLDFVEPISGQVYSGNWEKDMVYETVELPIQLEPTLASKSWGTLIDGVEYCQGEPTEENEIGTTRYAAEFRFTSMGGKYTMLERVERLANIGDGYSLQLPVQDSGNNLSPLCTVTAPLWSGYKVIVAYEKDIERNTANITVV